jgi:hypothetical protein
MTSFCHEYPYYLFYLLVSSILSFAGTLRVGVPTVGYDTSTQSDYKRAAGGRAFL